MKTLLDKIWISYKEFCIKNMGQRPTHIILNDNDFEVIKDEVIERTNINFLKVHPFRIFGMRIVRTMDIEAGDYLFTIKS